MFVIKKEEEKDYVVFMDLLACVLYKESVKNVSSLQAVMPGTEVVENSQAIAQAAGQVVLDRVIEETKDMSREQIIRWLTESSTTAMTSVMNKSEAYRHKIALLSKLL